VPKVKKKKVKKKKRLPVSKRKKKKSRKKLGKDLLASDGIKRTPGGKFPKGVCGNPKGRPKGSGHKYSATDLETAIQKVEEQKDTTFLEAWIKAAWGDAGDMALVANFMMPKLRAIEQLTIPMSDLSEEETEKWREEFKKRFGR